MEFCKPLVPLGPWPARVEDQKDEIGRRQPFPCQLDPRLFQGIFARADSGHIAEFHGPAFQCGNGG